MVEDVNQAREERLTDETDLQRKENSIVSHTVGRSADTAIN